jgi:hypothetical protein
MFALIAVPVSANGNTASPVSLSGNISSNQGYVSIGTNLTSLYMPLVPGSSATNSSLGITAVSNLPFHITIRDSTARSTDIGYMGNYSTTQAYAVLDQKLASPMGFTPVANGSTTVPSPLTSFSATGTTVYTGAVAQNSQVLASTFTQPVAVTDVILPAGYTYTIQTEFAITQN